MARYNSILETVGNTPIVRINTLGTKGVNLFVKVEAFNPLGSVKDRIGLNMIERAETQGFLQPDVIGYGALQINSYTTAMTCQSSNDASIVLNSIGSNTPFSYRWYKNGMLLPDTNSYLLNLSVGSYSYSVHDSKGNLRSNSLTVISGEGACTIIIHNGVSPNSDGHNDFFHIEHIEDYPGNKVSIYNRWGNMVWEENNYDNSAVAWKGEDKKGSTLSAGTYFFIVVIDGKKTTGWVELMR